NLSALAAQIEEAILVAVARQKKPASRSEMRVELPTLFREMGFIRNGPSSVGRPAEAYSLPRFVVELKSLIQSETNSKSSRRLRLETAVLENTKDARKSVFIPHDLSVGYGEGTYYQAVVAPPYT